jgi:hypothetical protein
MLAKGQSRARELQRDFGLSTPDVLTDKRASVTFGYDTETDMRWRYIYSPVAKSVFRGRIVALKAASILLWERLSEEG